MKFQIERAAKKEERAYKSIYLRKSVIATIDQLAKENNTSWNNVVASMIDACLEDLQQ